MTDEVLLGKLAAELAGSAGERMKNQLSTTGVVATKSSPVDVVTEVDRSTEAYLVEMLERIRPDDAILGEEGASSRGTTGVRWVLDPLDGTVNFTYGIPAFAVSVGVEIDGVAAVGAVYNPITDELYEAVRGNGAFCNGERLSVRNATTIDRALVATGFGYDSQRRADQARTLQRVLPAVRDIRRAGSAALDLCSVAAGRVDAYYELGVQPWDICAGIVIAAEAGAMATSFEGSQPQNDVVAAHPALHSELRRLITA